jgi:hypothetical protein
MTLTVVMTDQRQRSMMLVECDKMENTIDDHYGVDFVKGLPGSPEGWIPPGPPENWMYSAPARSPLEDEINNPY